MGWILGRCELEIRECARSTLLTPPYCQCHSGKYRVMQVLRNRQVEHTIPPAASMVSTFVAQRHLTTEGSGTSDALTALHYAIADRGSLYAYLLAARDTLEAASSSQAEPVTTITGERSILLRVSDIIRWCIESVPAGYEQPLFSDDAASLARTEGQIKKNRPFPSDAIDSDDYLVLGESFLDILQLNGKDKEIGRKAWRKLGQMIAARMRVGSSGSELEERDMGRSVRSL